MRCFIAPYEIHFDDTMAYGSHHFMTNFRFQCAAREGLLFSDALYRDPAFREDFDKVILYTAEAFTRNLGPANLGDRLVILLTVEERTSIGLRFCFRVLDETGNPVSAGFQSVICADRRGAVVAFPASFERAFDRVHDVIEPAREGTFRDAVLKGGKAARDLFPAEVRAWAAANASAGPRGVVDVGTPRLPACTTAILLGGQGTFDPAHLRGLVAALPEADEELASVAAVVQRRLGASLQPLLDGGPAGDDLDQIGILLSGVLGARLAARSGPTAQLVLGHSFGELAALVVGGVWTLTEGAEAVCARILALRPHADRGGLAAVGADVAATAGFLAALPRLRVAGVNHPRQTVVAGPAEDLDALAALAGPAAVPVTRVPSRWPFHHPDLAPAAEAFRRLLADLPARAPTVPVYSAIDGRLYAGESAEIADRLSGHLVRPFDFEAALRLAYDAGCRRFVDTTGGRLGRIATRVLGDTAELHPVETPPAPAPGTALPEDTIAIVSLGCLFPGGARDPEAFWRAMRDGQCGVVEDPRLDADFLARPLRADKTVTTLAGRVDDADIVPPAGLTAFAGYDRAQRLLAVALHQATAALRLAPGRTACLLGSTADGSEAFDDALSTQALLRELPAHLSQAAAHALRAASAADHAPHAALSRVVADQLGPVPTLLLDAACASSLYTVALGAAMLRSGEVDAAIAGGCFSPGPGNNALFSQFKGLSTTGIRPFDASADGVVFGEGAGIVVLKRLADAERDGDRVHAVLRGLGLASDGRASSANVPRAEGQLLAIERAWAGLDPAEVDFVEAHGTATPAGDATELDALQRFFGRQGSERLPIGSLKAHTGHLGWAAGAASLIKLCKMLEHGEMVRQHGFSAPGRAVAATRFEVLTAPRAWRRAGRPRRAAASGFGFGGTDAHVVIEEHLAGPRTPASPAAPGELAVVAMTGRYPAGARLPSDAFALPDGLRLLPDLADDLDPTQRLAVRGVHDLLAAIDRPALRPETALVVGLEGKTVRALEALQRVLRDRTVRRLSAAAREGHAPTELAEAASERIGRLRPSTAYTLQAMMPNVTPGRAANLLDLQGPNFVVDQGCATFAAALASAPRLLALGARLVIAGGVHAGDAVPDHDGRAPSGDGLALVALMRPEEAAAHGLTVLARLSPRGTGAAPAPSTLDRRGAEGGAALLDAIQRAGRGETREVTLPGGSQWQVAPAGAPRHVEALEPAAPGFGTQAAVRYATPTLTPRDPAGRPLLLDGRRVLALGDDALDGALRDRGALVRRIPVDATTEATAASALAEIQAFAPELILVVRALTASSFDDALSEATSDRRVQDTAFLALRQLYPSLTAGAVDVCALHLGGVDAAGVLHPATGGLAGMLKSVARELPEGRVRVVTVDHADPVLALDQACTELSDRRDPAVESAWIGGRRHVRVLRELARTASGPSPLGPDAVILATGGAKGVTAVLVEELLRRHACTVVLVGRSTTDGVPADLLEADEATLDARESAFYAEAAAQDPTARLPELRRRFARWRSAHELHHTLRHLATLPGRVEYVAADITREDDVAAVLDGIHTRHGRLDLLLHGAGMQTSKRLDRRKLDELRANMDVKLLGVRWLREGTLRRFGEVPLHALTSAFSYFGNDGQADYGAANETLDRLCAAASARAGVAPWTSLGWLAWDRIGMTRSPEYAVLGAARNLRGIGAAEGAALFSQVIEGAPHAAVFHQVTDGEIAWYGLEVLAPTEEVELSSDTLPCLDAHLVRGTPTVPGAWTLDRLVPADVTAAPAFEARDIEFSRFVRAPRGRRPVLRVHSDPDGTRHLVGDVRHPNGAVLQADVPHARATFRACEGPLTPRLGGLAPEGVPVDDPYCAPDSPVGLSGPFRCLTGIRVGPKGRVATFRAPGPLGAHRLPALLLDSAWRLSAMHAEGVGSQVVHAPVRFDRATFDREALARTTRPITLRATAPRVEGDVVRCDLVEAIDDEGRVLLSVEGGIARRIP